jgi:hypothetical protein
VAFIFEHEGFEVFGGVLSGEPYGPTVEDDGVYGVTQDADF